ncbi:MAG TPA: 3-deoxy-7-phosphoheptulonate synthase [Polyangiaceae bacterium]|nr:3-deoxy-7-phosphoheptulonate synthase [Polyangiaceae bacterium]
MPQIENSHIASIAPLVCPREMKKSLPLPSRVCDLVLANREEIQAMVHGRDPARLMVVVGPCSIHDPEAAYEYAERLLRVAQATREHLLVVMRTYFEKPRTVVGWKGLISDPRLDGSCDIPAGLPLARKVLLGIGAMGLPCGTEFLDPIVPQYVSDLVSWAAIGARTIESQTHRQMASGLSMPIGFKNGTDGSLPNAVNGLLSAREPHAFLGIDADGVTSVVKTTGNPDGHLVLRGGRGKSNYHADDIASAAEFCATNGIARGVMIDCSHDNSGKDHTKQAAIFRQVVDAFREGQTAILGLMIESNLHPGKQTWSEGKELARGVSITDSCMGWEETEALLTMAAEGAARRASA